MTTPKYLLIMGSPYSAAAQVTAIASTISRADANG
jgi:hypothetical protein